MIAPVASPVAAVATAASGSAEQTRAVISAVACRMCGRRSVRAAMPVTSRARCARVSSISARRSGLVPVLPVILPEYPDRTELIRQTGYLPTSLTSTNGLSVNQTA